MKSVIRYLAPVVAALALLSCSRDPDVVKKKYLDSGNKYYDRGKYKEASIMYRRALNKDQKFGEAHYHLALTSLKLGQISNAAYSLRRAVELMPPGTPDANDASLKLAEILLQAYETSEMGPRDQPLIAEVRQMTGGMKIRDPNTMEVHKLTGDLHLVDAVADFRKQNSVDSKKAMEEAVGEYRQALKIKPEDKIVTLALARTLGSYGETAEAEALYRKLIASDKTMLSPYTELYKLDVGLKKLPEAEAVLKQAIANNPNAYQLQLMLATLYFSEQNRPEMVKVLDQLKTHVKEYPAAYMTAGDFYFRIGDMDEAIRQYQQGIAQDPPKKIDYQKHIIEVLTRQGKNQEAYDKDLEILKEDPKDPEARGMKASYLLDKGDVTQAITELQQVVTAKPDNFVARFNLGRAHYARQEYEQAIQQFQKAVELRPDYLRARLALTQIALVRGDNDSALNYAEEAEKRNPESGAAKLLKAASLMRLQRNDEARVLLEKLLAANPRQPDTLLQMGVLNLNQKRYKESLENFQKAYQADPTNLRGLLGEAEVLFIEGQHEQALKLIRTESEKYPDRLALKRELANGLMKTGQFDQALVAYRELADKYKSNPREEAEVYANIGQTYAMKGDLPHGVEALRQAQAYAPDNIFIMNFLAQLLDRTGQHTDAQKYYQRSLERDPNNPEALNNLAFLMAENGSNLDEALTLANRAKQKLPNFTEVSDTIGWIYLKKNLSSNAVEIFSDLVKKVDQNPTYHYHYAMALMQKGDKVNAAKECRAALERKPTKEEEGHIRELLARAGATG